MAEISKSVGWLQAVQTRPDVSKLFPWRFVARTPSQLQKIRRVARAPKTEALDQNLDRLSPDLPKSLNEGIFLKSY